LPPDRRGVVERVWKVVRANIPKGYTEEIGPNGPMFKAGDEWYVCLANQKNYVSLYLMPVYVFPKLKFKLDNAGKKLKGGKSCINFKRAEDLPLETIGEIVGAHDADAYTKQVRKIRETSRAARKSGKGKE
jgi:hypothetical protein